MMDREEWLGLAKEAGLGLFLCLGKGPFSRSHQRPSRRAHHWEYDVCAGKGRNPATARLKPFAVKVENGEILVDIG